MKITDKIWYSFTSSKKYEGLAPPFFEVENETWYATLMAGKEEIKQEFLSKHQQEFRPYYNNTFANKENQWQIIPLKFWGLNKRKMGKSYPIANAIINKIPFVSSATFSKLNPQTSIDPHVGDSNIMYRIHVPLIIPAKLPACGFKISDKSISWDENKIFAFCDAHQHEAWNNTNEDRVIFILDIIRPEFQESYKWNRSQLLATLWLQFAFQKTNILAHIPFFIKKMLMNFLACFAFVYVPIHNFFINE